MPVPCPHTGTPTRALTPQLRRRINCAPRAPCRGCVTTMRLRSSASTACWGSTGPRSARGGARSGLVPYLLRLSHYMYSDGYCWKCHVQFDCDFTYISISAQLHQSIRLLIDRSRYGELPCERPRGDACGSRYHGEIQAVDERDVGAADLLRAWVWHRTRRGCALASHNPGSR